MIKFFSVFLITLLIFFTSLPAKTIKERTLQELYLYSDVVVYADILTGEVNFHEDSPCGAIYSAKINNTFKGENVPMVMNFGRYFGLKIGSSYLLFMKWKSAAENNENYSSDILEEEYVACDGLTPGYMYLGDGFFENKNGFFKIMPDNKAKDGFEIDNVFFKLEQLKEKDLERNR